jgi:hypothetical protein
MDVMAKREGIDRLDARGGPTVTIIVPLSGDTLEAELEADESGVLMLYEPSRAGSTTRSSRSPRC